MNNVMDDLAELHNKKHRYDIDLIQVEKDKDYVVYNDLIFEDEGSFEEYLRDSEDIGGDCDTIAQFERYRDSIIFSNDVKIKTGEELLKEALERE